MGGVITRRGVFAAAAFAVCPNLALAAETFPDFPVPSAEKIISFGNSDLAISAYPLKGPEDQKVYFGMDLGAAGVLPIWLSIQNLSSTKRFLIDVDDIKLAYGSLSLQEAERSRSTIDDSGARVTANAAAIGMAAGPIGLAVSLPILLMSGGVIARQDDVRRNLMVRQLYSRTVGPGQSAVGFVYGKSAQQNADLSKFRLSITAKPIPVPPGGGGVSFEATLASPPPSAPVQQSNLKGSM
jgi:hypothetical protein